MLKLDATEPIARKIYLKHKLGGNKKLAKKAIKKPKEKAKPTPKSKKEIKSEKPNTKIELKQNV
jgi:hypothetical protein